ncbi:MAG: RsbRD N-terminal domain-containing protein, partial [Planctomycetota bacterium]
PPDAAKLFARQKDRFRNPVGSTVASATEALFDALLDGAVREDLERVCEPIVRMRAVQDFLPSEAVGSLLRLKDVVLEAISAESVDRAEVERFLARVDEAVLVAFDVYVRCRERIYELRAKEAWNRSFKLLERAGFVEEIPEGLDDEAANGNMSADRGVDR